jgi:hypothetical protein
MLLADKELVYPGQAFPDRREGWKCKERARSKSPVASRQSPVISLKPQVHSQATLEFRTFTLYSRYRIYQVAYHFPVVPGLTFPVLPVLPVLYSPPS